VAVPHRSFWLIALLQDSFLIMPIKDVCHSPTPAMFFPFKHHSASSPTSTSARALLPCPLAPYIPTSIITHTLPCRCASLSQRPLRVLSAIVVAARGVACWPLSGS